MRLERILLATHHYPPERVGGAELLAQRIARKLVQQGIAVQVVCIENVRRADKTSITGRDETDGAVRVRRLDLELAQDEDLRLWFDAPLLRSEFESLCDSWQPEIVHLVSGYLMGLAPLNAARRRGIPTVITLTDFWFLCPTIQLLRSDGSLCEGPEALECARCLLSSRRVFHTLDERVPALMRAWVSQARAHSWLDGGLHVRAQLAALNERHAHLMDALNHADALLPLTNFVVAMHRRNGFDADMPITQIDCFDTDDFDAVEPRLTRRNEIHFGYLGQITPVKGVEVLLRAFLKLRANSETPIYLHIHGKLNAQSSYSRTLQKLAGNSPRIIFHGTYEHGRALALLNELDAVVVPSVWHENVPRVIFEAFAAKCPVIGSRVGGITEAVTDGKNGLLFERGSADDLARVMQKIVDEPSLVAELKKHIPPPRPLAQDINSVLTAYELARRKHVREPAH